MKFNEKTLNDKLIYKGKIIDVHLKTVEIQDGNKAKREIVNHPGGVAILAFKDKNTILMVEQFRKPMESLLIELPAGKIEPNEDKEVCARRELEEETGYKSKKVTYLGKVVSSPGFCDEIIYIYKAENLYKGQIGGDEDEFINVYEFNINEIKEMIKEGKIIDAKTLSAFMML